MKRRFLITLLTILSLTLGGSVLAQENSQPAGQPLQGGQQPVQPQNTSANQGAIGNISATVTARTCVKVGAPTDPKPAICNQATSPTLGSGGNAQQAPTIEAGQLVQTIKDQFGVSMQGAWDEKHLQWIYEKFYELKQTTKFIDYIQGQPVTLTTGIPNQETGFVQMSQIGDYAYDRDYFLGTLIHEFGHTIYHQPLPQNLRGEVDNLYSKINCVSTYKRCQSDRTENYPEIIAYCVNPKAVGSIRQEIWAQYRELAVQIMGFCYN